MAIAFFLIGVNFVRQRCQSADAAVKTLFCECSEFKFSHIEPTGLLWRVVEFEPLHQVMRSLRGKGFIERPGVVCVQVVLHQANTLGIRVVLLELSHKLCVFFLGASWKHPQHAPTP